jgi:hypothetical protein
VSRRVGYPSCCQKPYHYADSEEEYVGTSQKQRRTTPRRRINDGHDLTPSPSRMTRRTVGSLPRGTVALASYETVISPGEGPVALD